MPITKRDQAIINSLRKFRVMDRDSIAEIFFGDVKRPHHSANNVLLRLMRDGRLQRSTAYSPYLYFPAESAIKKNSAKIGHFLAILGVYKELRKLGDLGTFSVEPKYGSKGAVEPDIYCQYRRTGFFVEVQRTVYSEKQMNAKLGRYVDFHRAGIMADPFPHVLILGDHRYAIDERDYPFRIFQAESFSAFVESLKQRPAPAPKESGIKVRIG